MCLGTIWNLDKRSFNYLASKQVVSELRLHSAPSNHCLFTVFSGHSSTNEHKIKSSSRLNTVRVSDPVGITVPFYDIWISSLSQTIANCASKISEYSLKWSLVFSTRLTSIYTQSTYCIRDIRPNPVGNIKK